MDVEQTHNKQKYRGKLYALSEESTWEDTGTGHTSITRTGDSRRLVFRDEESGEVLHDRPVFPADTYQLQGEGERQTIIVWEDPETHKDWALSFQDPDGTAEIWEAICGEPSAADDKRFLPLPKLGNLVELCRMLTCVPPSQREALATECMSHRFLNSLRDAFHMAEDLNNEEALAHLWLITKGVFLLSNQKLTERYLKQDAFEDVLGMLEYDSGLPADKRIPHRQVLKVKVQFNPVVSFEDQETLDRIHLNYRLQYLKDIVLPRLLDDASFVSLTQMIHANISLILSHLQRSPQILDSLLLQVRRRDLQSLLFLQDACRLAKQIPPPERQALYEKLVERKLFEVLVPFFGEDAAKGEPGTLQPRHLAVEVLLLSALNDPSHLRCFLTADSSAEGRTLLSALIRVMLTEQDQGVQGQTAEMLKAVMDPTALEHRERDGCLDVFYDRGALDELVAPLRADAGKPVGPPACFGQQLICELLAFAVTHHGFRAKIYVMRHGLAQQAMRLMAAPQRFLQLAPVRLLRAIVGTKDEAYHRYLTKSGLFAPLLRNFQQSLQPPALGGNLLISVTLEMLEFIRVGNLKILVDHICRKHGDLLHQHASKFKTLEGLLLKHQQNREYEAFPPEQHAAGGPISRADSVGHPGRARSPGREDSDDDEAYFESLDEEEDTASTSAPQEAESLLQSSGDGAHGDPGARRARLLAAAGRAFGPGAGGAGAGAGALKAKEQEGSTGTSSLQGLLGGYEEDEEEDEEAACRGDAAEADTSVGQEIANTGASTDATVATEEPSRLDAAGSNCDSAVGDTGESSASGADTCTDSPSANERPDAAVAAAAVEAEGHGSPPGHPASAEAASGEQADVAPCPTVATEDEAAEAARTESGGGEAEEAEEAEAKGGGPGGERALNHLSKRLKTSASVQA
uniref:Serine/threonine-protein phosphatase 4 regulatory subunit 3-like central domain-containing protein n=1 Tax=Alexandrium monilatum TaxID=311494 RepID=A0A7S4VU90_9DINO|mmetsp:Transcript_86892/g.274331  ORF Transcript_86892/g.274331 Transcript_86892/m.274331 type:complete len:916 (+) Transcript_86892:79-2826(+)